MDDETQCISCGGADPRCSAYHPAYGFSCILPPHSGPHYDTSGGHWTEHGGQLGNPAEIPSNALVEVDVVVRSVRFDLDAPKSAQGLDTELLCLHVQQPIGPGTVPLVCVLAAGHGGAHRNQHGTTWEPLLMEFYGRCDVRCGPLGCTRSPHHLGLHLDHQGQEWIHPREAPPSTPWTVGDHGELRPTKLWPDR